MAADYPSAARDVPPGTPWSFRDHRTVAQVWVEAAETMATTTVLDLQELMGRLSQHIHKARADGDERTDDEIGSEILIFGEMPDIGHVLQWLRECDLVRPPRNSAIRNAHAVLVLPFRKPS